MLIYTEEEFLALEDGTAFRDDLGRVGEVFALNGVNAFRLVGHTRAYNADQAKYPLNVLLEN